MPFCAVSERSRSAFGAGLGSGVKTQVMHPSATEQRRTWMRSGRKLWVAVGGTVATLLLAGCTGTTSSDRPQPRGSSTGSTVAPSPLGATASLNGLTFRHPSSWRVYPYTYSFSFDDLLGELSTQSLQDPCTVRTASELTVGRPSTL